MNYEQAELPRTAMPRQHEHNFQPQAAVTTQPPGWPLIYQVVSRRNPMNRVYEKYNSVKSMKLGTVQIVAGVVAVVANIAGIIVQAVQHYRGHLHYNDYRHGDSSIRGNYYWDVSYAYYFGSGIWCPIFIFLSGAFARFAAKRKTRCVVITHMVLAIWGSLFAFIMLGFSVWAMAYDSYRLFEGFNFNVYRDDRSYHNRYDYHRTTTTSWPSTTIRAYAHWAAPAAKGSLFLALVLLAASVTAFVASVWGSVLCCKVLCCGSSGDDDDTVEPLLSINDQPSSQPQIIILDKRGRPLKLEQVRWWNGINWNTGQPVLAQQAVGHQTTDGQVAMGAQCMAPQKTGIPYQTSEPPPYSNMT